MSGGLTKAQRELLALVGSQHTIRTGLKMHLAGDGWRVLDQLAAHGLVRHAGFGAYQITEAGRSALLKGEDDGG
jgi:hypothetical protein